MSPVNYGDAASNYYEAKIESLRTRLALAEKYLALIAENKSHIGKEDGYSFETMKDPDAYMMAFVLPDKYYKKYVSLLKMKKWKDADLLVDKYGWSQI